jgi:uncharacterized protein DUF6551
VSTNPTHPNRKSREARLQWVPLALMVVSPVAQREITPSRVDKMVANFDLEKLGTPTVNRRDAKWWIVDGQHRVEALRAIGWADQQIQCWTYDGLTEEEEAEAYLSLNDVLPQKAYDKFRISITAGREAECDIDRIVRSQDLVVSRDKIDGSVSCVGTLLKIYHRDGAKVLRRALRIAYDAFGNTGLEVAVLDGMGLLCGRYNGDLEDQVATAKLGKIQRGADGLMQKAELIRRSTGIQRSQAVAAAAVEIINAGRGGKKLPSWFREDAA